MVVKSVVHGSCKEISVRLELADIKTMPSVQGEPSNEGPWSAKDLCASSQLRCRACHTQLLTNEVPLEFKDLPSEHWAEMMDFWHCHRPHDANQNQAHAEQAAEAKGYGSSSRLKAAPGVAFVDTTSIFLAEQNCIKISVRIIIPFCWTLSSPTPEYNDALPFKNLYTPKLVTIPGKKKETFAAPETVSCSGRRYTCPKSKSGSPMRLKHLLASLMDVWPLVNHQSQCFSVLSPQFWYSRDMGRHIKLTEHQNAKSKLYCSNCKALLGVQDSSLEGWRIFKSGLSIKASLDAQWESFAPEIFISSQLISLIESSAARKFVVHCDEAEKGLLVSSITDVTMKQVFR